MTDGPDDPHAPRDVPRTIVREVVLSRPWRCACCETLMKKGAAAVVHITPGGGANRVYHPDCTPAR